MNERDACAMTVLYPDGRSEHVAVSRPRNLSELRRVVAPLLPDAAEIERVFVQSPRCGRKTTMAVDEMAVLKGLPCNQQATELYRATWIAEHPGETPDALPCIAGTAVLFEEPLGLRSTPRRPVNHHPVMVLEGSVVELADVDGDDPDC